MPKKPLAPLRSFTPVDCLYPECGKRSSTRGLCRSHYQTARNLVSQERITWEQLEKLGKALPKKKTGRVGSGVIAWLLQDEKAKKPRKPRGPNKVNRTTKSDKAKASEETPKQVETAS